MTPPLFVFGTLRDADVLAAVLGRPGTRTEPAQLTGRRARTVAGRDYPVLVPDPGARAPGALVHGLDAVDRARLAWFEGEAYALAPCRPDTGAGPVDAVFFDAVPSLPVAGPWDLDGWRREAKAGFLERARTWMDELDSAHPLADSVVWGHGPGNDEPAGSGRARASGRGRTRAGSLTIAPMTNDDTASAPTASDTAGSGPATDRADAPEGDQAFRAGTNAERWPDAAYAGALSFLRRRYTTDLAGVDVAVSGIPFDSAVTYRSGCRLGPRAIRAASVQLAELLAFPSGIDPLTALSIVDAGDCLVDPQHPAGVVERIEAHARRILDAGARTLTFGGDHFVSWPLLRAHAAVHGPIALVQFDAHCDTWEDDASAMDHGTMFARAAAAGVVDSSRSTQVGLRTWNDTDAGFEILTAPWVHRHGIDAALEIVRARAGDAPVYLSFDIDGLDPAFAPGTGTPVIGGLASWQAVEFVRGLAGLDLVGMDVVEVAPAYDHAEITALAAATVAHDWLVCVAMNAGAVRAPAVGRQ